MLAIFRVPNSICRAGAALAAVALLGGYSAAIAAEGAIEINQASAEAGGVTSGDGAGFPVQINESGSYIMTSNLVVPGNTTGIDFGAARDVTIDLNGFAIIGPNRCDAQLSVACSGGGSGVGILGGEQAIVKNGIVRGFGSDGVSLGRNSRVERLTVSDCGSPATDVAAIKCTECLVTYSTVHNNGGGGIAVGQRSVVSNNTVRFSGRAGILAESSNISQNRVFASGSTGISVGPDAHVVGNHVEFSGTKDGGSSPGISATGYGIVKDNIVAGGGSIVMGSSGGGPPGRFLYSGNNSATIILDLGVIAVQGGPNFCRNEPNGLCP